MPAKNCLDGAGINGQILTDSRPFSCAREELRYIQKTLAAASQEKMKRIIQQTVMLLLGFMCATTVFGADANSGKNAFRAQCALWAIVPDVPFQAHSAALTLTFYTANQGASAFPKDYIGDGFAVLHGSWNRAFRTGHKVVRLPMKNGVPTGEYIDFMVGFITEDGNMWGRPVGSVVASDGSLLISDDGSNVIYRISYSK